MKYKRYPRFSLRNQRDNAIKLRFFKYSPLVLEKI